MDLAIIELAPLAASGEHAKIARLLSTRDSWPRGSLSLALGRAAGRGRAECVKRLIPFSDSKAYDSAPLMAAPNAPRS